MKVLIMAAGIGSRISRHLNGQPKCCVKIGEIELIKYTVALLNKKGITDSIGIDPYLCNTYNKKTNNECLNLSFEDIETNGLNINKQTIICSYALHLCPKSFLNNLLYNLSINCEYFILISPSKYPIIEDDYFELMFSTIINKTHCKIFKSVLK
jgi:choline kinase